MTEFYFSIFYPLKKISILLSSVFSSVSLPILSSSLSLLLQLFD